MRVYVAPPPPCTTQLVPLSCPASVSPRAKVGPPVRLAWVGASGRRWPARDPASSYAVLLASYDWLGAMSGIVSAQCTPELDGVLLPVHTEHL